MSRSVKLRPKFTDPSDRLYLGLLGTSVHQQRMEEARVRTAPFVLPQLKDAELKIPLLSDFSGMSKGDAWESGFAPAFTAEQQKVLEYVSRLAEDVGYRSEVKALPSSAGGIVIDLVKSKREGVYVMREVRHE